MEATELTGEVQHTGVWHYGAKDDPRPQTRPPILTELWQAMGCLYQARYIATGPEGPVDGKHYPEMDRDTFDEIAYLQTKLQSLISRLERETKDGRSKEGDGLQPHRS